MAFNLNSLFPYDDNDDDDDDDDEDDDDDDDEEEEMLVLYLICKICWSSIVGMYSTPVE